MRYVIPQNIEKIFSEIFSYAKSKNIKLFISDEYEDGFNSIVYKKMLNEVEKRAIVSGFGEDKCFNNFDDSVFSVKGEFTDPLFEVTFLENAVVFEVYNLNSYFGAPLGSLNLPVVSFNVEFKNKKDNYITVRVGDFFSDDYIVENSEGATPEFMVELIISNLNVIHLMDRLFNFKNYIKENISKKTKLIS